MTTRTILLSTTMLLLPLAAVAQTPQQPVLGMYIGAAGGFNIKTDESINNFRTNLGILDQVNTPNASLSTGIGAAALGTFGYGLGNGLRVEIEYDYRSNSFSNTSAQRFSGIGVSTGASGNERLMGGMVNADYDFVNLIPWVVPYVGVGVGYQWAKLNGFSTTANGPVGSTTVSSNDTVGGFAAQGIVGAAYNVPQVPGLALTAEYRIMALPGTRTYDALFRTVTPGRVVAPLGTFQLGHDLNNTFFFGVRYNFGAAPPAPPPAPAPIAAPAPAPSRSYLVFFDWDKATLTERARQIIKDAATTRRACNTPASR